MKLTHNPNLIEFRFKNNNYSFLKSGNIYSFKQNNTMVNGFFGSFPNGSINNIWLRVYKNNSIENVYPLMGMSSNANLSYNKNGIRFSGNLDNISYIIDFYAQDNIWFWDVELVGNGEMIDLVYGQDIGLATVNNLLENELYMAQYLGHTVFKEKNGYVICSRQNQPQDDLYPYVQQGMLKGNVTAYSTDAFQFFEKSYKFQSNIGCLNTDLDSKNMQFECSYTALQSEKVNLTSKMNFVFYGISKNNHNEAISQVEFTSEIENAYNKIKKTNSFNNIPKIKLKDNFSGVLNGLKWSIKDIQHRYPNRNHEEILNGELLSFFTDDNSHFVFQQKELLVNRPHGNIITTLINPKIVDNNLITSTNYINGIFNSQTVIGNTSMNKLLSASRGLLDFFKTSGQRIWISIEGKFHLLNLPSIFETGLNYSKWYYDIGFDVLVITSYAKAKSTSIVLDIKSENNLNYDFIVTNQIVMGKHEFTTPVKLVKNNSTINILRDDSYSSNTPYPKLNYTIDVKGADYTLESDSIFYDDELTHNSSILCIKFNNQSSFQLDIKGSMYDTCIPDTGISTFDVEKNKYINFYEDFMSGFSITSSEKNKDLEKLNTIMWWFTHNALVHYAVPHGLEQSGGAAWGTRDVSQGPLELFLATQNYDLARNVILEIFSHQLSTTGEWPQWFMFDNYPDAMDDCHGDVIFWPLKCIADYITTTNDTSILLETLPFQDTDKNYQSQLITHIELAINSIKKRFLKDTSLISYDGGDWDDTLQPASKELKENLVSSWTQALAYHTLSTLSIALETDNTQLSSNLKKLSDEIKISFEKYLIIDGVIPGFVYRTSDDEFQPLLHPLDTKTGINYRLLPMTRSIIANLVNPKQASLNFELIDKHLYCPDGVRLMDKPAQYNGGTSKLFLRAERAANVGREVSLQYTHAHIRYIESLCHIGNADKAWKSLLQINPINIAEIVPRALPRQSNLYFTSSEGVFYDRYEYARDFNKLREGTIDVNGGWRLYSSGPGIYVKNVIENFLGIKLSSENLTIDPVLNLTFDGVKLQYKCFNSMCTFNYHIKTGTEKKLTIKINDVNIDIQKNDNPYRKGGIEINKSYFTNSKTEIDVYLTI